jgi:DNA-binding NtrC family response regulator
MAQQTVKGSVLVVDDEKNLCLILWDFLQAENYAVRYTEDPCQTLVLMQEEAADIVISDLRMPKMDGMELLGEIKTRYPETEVILMSAYATVENAITAMKRGAYDYVLKPFQLDEILITINKAREKQLDRQRIRILEDAVEKKYSFDQMVGKSPAMQKVFDLIQKIAPSDSTVLITGESGTGKELAARSIHYNSSRKNKPFVAINCGGIPGELLESELFGYEKGAFTGAANRKKGLFESADGGTLFMDEVGELPAPLQVKLLRVLQDGEFRRLGGLENIKADVRIIAATNRDLQDAVKKKEFREDLYFRLNVIPLQLPPLRERLEDIPLLAQSFLKSFAEKNKRTKIPTLSADAMKRLLRYPWPGNIREMENLLEQLLILTSGDVIRLEDLPEQFQESRYPVAELSDEAINYQEAKNRFEKEYFSRVLRRNKWNITRAAAEADMSRRNMYEKIKALGLRPPWETFEDNP